MKNLDHWIGRKIGLPHFTARELEAYQFDRFQNTLERARKMSQYYQKKLLGHPVESLRKMKDIEKLPLTNQMDLKTSPMEFLAVSQQQVKKIATLNSSGTTGAAKRIFFSEADLNLTVDFFENGMGVFTESGDRVLVLLPGKTPASIGDLLKKALKRLGAESVIYGMVDDSKRVSEIILKEKITGIVGIPQQVFLLSQEKEATAIKVAGNLRTVLLSTDYVSPSISRRIRENWSVEVFEHYGSTEMGYGGGVFCGAKKGYHMREADLYMEIIDPLTQKSLPDGKMGEVVFTTLTREAMPLIRYRTGDYGRYLKEDCDCQTVLKTLERIKNRVENRIFVENGQDFYLSEFDDLIFDKFPISDFYVGLSSDDLNQKVIEVDVIFDKKLDERNKRGVLCEMEAQLEGMAEMKIGRARKMFKICEGQALEVDTKGIRKRSIRDRRKENE